MLLLLELPIQIAVELLNDSIELLALFCDVFMFKEPLLNRLIPKFVSNFVSNGHIRIADTRRGQPK